MRIQSGRIDGNMENEKRPKDAHRTKKTTVKHTNEIATRINRRQRKQNKDREAIPSVRPKKQQTIEDTRDNFGKKKGSTRRACNLERKRAHKGQVENILELNNEPCKQIKKSITQASKANLTQTKKRNTEKECKRDNARAVE